MISVSVKIINEKWPEAIDQLLSPYEKKNLSSYLVRQGLDIENTDNELVQISNNRDPRLKDGVIIVKFNNAKTFGSRTRPVVGIWFNGQCIKDANLGTDKNWKDIMASRQSWKNLLARDDIEVYMMVIDPEVSQAMRNKRANRYNSQNGAIARYRKVKNGYGMEPVDNIGKSALKSRGIRFDKSGYIEPNPDKYKNMLADLQLSNAQSILDSAADMYKKLAANISKYGGDDDWGSGSYVSTMERILRCFRDLSRVLKEYNDDKWEYARNYSKEQVKKSLKDMREILKGAEKYLA